MEPVEGLYRFDPNEVDFNEPGSVHQFTLTVNEFLKTSNDIARRELKKYNETAKRGDSEPDPRDAVEDAFGKLQDWGNALMADIRRHLGPEFIKVPPRLRPVLMLDNTLLDTYLAQHLKFLKHVEAQVPARAPNPPTGWPRDLVPEFDHLEKQFHPIPAKLEQIAWPFAHFCAGSGSSPPFVIKNPTSPEDDVMLYEMRRLAKALRELRDDLENSYQLILFQEEAMFRVYKSRPGSLRQSHIRMYEFRRKYCNNWTSPFSLPEGLRLPELERDFEEMKDIQRDMHRKHVAWCERMDAAQSNAIEVLAGEYEKMRDSYIPRLGHITRDIQRSPWLSLECSPDGQQDDVEEEEEEEEENGDDNIPSWTKISQLYSGTRSAIELVQKARRKTNFYVEGLASDAETGEWFVEMVKLWVETHEERMKVSETLEGEGTPELW